MTAAGRAEGAVLAWARLYTRGVGDELAERRLAELASDCHEQRQWGVQVGASSLVVATSMVARTLAGLPADLHWRHSNRATVRDPSPRTTGSIMDWTRRNWWLVLAALAGTLQVALAISIPLEDGTGGSLVGGLVVGGAGVTVLAGILVRRSRRVTGDLMVAGGVLPLMSLLWTVVLPIMALAVMVPALFDAADARARGPGIPASEPATSPTSGRLRLVAIGLLTSAVAVTAVVGAPNLVLVLVAPALGLVLGVLATTRVRLPLVRAGLVMVSVGFVQGLATWLFVSGLLTDWTDPLDATATEVLAAGTVGQVVGALGLVLVFVGLARRQVRPG